MGDMGRYERVCKGDIRGDMSGAQSQISNGND